MTSDLNHSDLPTDDECAVCGDRIETEGARMFVCKGVPIHKRCFFPDDDDLSEEITKAQILELLHPWLDLGTFLAPSWAIKTAAALMNEEDGK
jgi:hypothetical protein